MKRRIIKKWINRYIAPMVKDLPRTNTRNDRISITIINGEIIPEGNTTQVEYNPKRAIEKQIQGLRKVLEANKGKKIYVRNEAKARIHDNQPWDRPPEQWRKHPKKKFYGIGMRLLVAR